MIPTQKSAGRIVDRLLKLEQTQVSYPRSSKPSYLEDPQTFISILRMQASHALAQSRMLGRK